MPRGSRARLTARIARIAALPAHGPDGGGAVLDPQERRLGEPYPVLARNRAPEGDHGPHELAHRPLGGAGFPRVVPVVHDVHVQVPVGKVAERGYGKARLPAQALEKTGEGEVLAHRDDDILVQLGIAELEHRSRAGTAHLPEAFGLGAAAGRAVGDAVARRPPEDQGALLADLGRAAGKLEEKDRAARLPLEDELSRRALGAVDRVPVQEFADRRLHPQGEERKSRPEGVRFRAERDEERPALGGPGYQLERRVGDDPEHPLAPDPEVPQVESGRELLGRGAPLHPLAGGQESLEREDEVAGDAVLSAVHPAGVAGDVSPDRAVFLRGRVRRVEPALPLGGGLDALDGRPGLDVGHSGLGVDPDTVPSVEVQHPAAAGRRRGPGKACPPPANGHGHAVPVCQRKEPRHVRAVAREHDRQGREGDLAAVKGRRPGRVPVGADHPWAEGGLQLLRGSGKIHGVSVALHALPRGRKTLRHEPPDI